MKIKVLKRDIMKTRLIAIGILIGMLIEFAIIAINAPNITGGCKTEIDTTTIKPLKTNNYGNNN